ncbi:hypothetical protein [Aureliella helgolandensis]|uniref:Competence protein A n=1 Tax=Aureliella helgolandensis TaxID=2527968 RepID=A0A518GHR2_9BACT|nr:hypothetical protein [Aureliella helgolandensis]QDV28127.1 hypothetical protein Q31a_65220 [Aureliella helgolandensis]
MLKNATRKSPRRFSFRAGFKQCGLGIDVGWYSTKVVWCRSQGRRFSEVACVSLPTQAGSTGTYNHGLTDSNDGLLGTEPRPAEAARRMPANTSNSVADGLLSTNEQFDFSRWSSHQFKSLASRIASAVGDRSVTRAEVRIAMSMVACDFRNVHVQPGEPISLASIQQNIQEALGDPRPRTIAILATEGPRPKIRALSLPQELSNGLAESLDHCSMTPLSIEGTPWGVAEAMLQLQDSTSAINIAIDWSYGDPTLVCLVDNQIDYIRKLTSGGVSALAAQAVQDLGLTPGEAVRWLNLCSQKDSVTPERIGAQRQTQDWVKSNCLNMAKEVNSTIDFMRWRHPGKSLGDICLLGGGAHLSIATDHFQGMLAHPSRVWSRSVGNHQLSAEYAIAYAMAVKGMHHAPVQ